MSTLLGPLFVKMNPTLCFPFQVMLKICVVFYILHTEDHLLIASFFNWLMDGHCSLCVLCDCETAQWVLKIRSEVCS